MTPPGRPRLGVFGYRDFRLLWAGQVVSNLGDSFHNLALLWMVKEMTGSALLMGTVMAASSLSFVLIGPIAGVYADRLEKRTVMLAMDLVRAALVALLAVLYQAASLATPAVVLLAVAMGASSSFFEPARQGSLVHLAARDELTQANSFSMLTRQVSQLAGPVAAGLVVAAWGIAPAFWIDAASFVLSALAIGAMRLRTLGGGTAHAANGGTGWGRTWHDLVEGVRTLTDHPVLRWIFPVAVIANFLFGPVPVLLPVYVDRVSDLGPVALGYLEGAIGAGMLCGSMVMALRGNRLPKGPTAIAGVFGMGLATVGFGLAPGLDLALGAFGLWGLFIPSINVPVFTLMQEEVPPEQQGRAFSVLMASAMAAQPISMATGGALGDLVGVRAVYTVAGLALLALALWTASVKALREAR